MPEMSGEMEVPGDSNTISCPQGGPARFQQGGREQEAGDGESGRGTEETDSTSELESGQKTPSYAPQQSGTSHQTAPCCSFL